MVGTMDSEGKIHGVDNMQTSSLEDKVKLLKSQILCLTVCNDDDDDNNGTLFSSFHYNIQISYQ